MSDYRRLDAVVTPEQKKVGNRAPGKRHRRVGVRGRRWGLNAIGVVFGLLWLFPAYWMVNTSLLPRNEVLTTTPNLFPKNATILNFVSAWNTQDFVGALRNSIVVTLGAVIVGLAIGLFAATALTRFHFRGRGAIMIAILVVQMLPGLAMLIPTYLIFNDLGLTNTYFGLILAYVAGVLPFSIWVLRGFLLAIPIELDEAAVTEGAGPIRILWSILFPLVMPGVVATSIFAFVAAWNDYLIAFVFMKDPEKYTLPIWLGAFQNPLTGVNFGPQMAASVMFAIPVVIFFLLIQKRLVAGLSAGAVKG